MNHKPTMTSRQHARVTQRIIELQHEIELTNAIKWNDYNDTRLDNAYTELVSMLERFKVVHDKTEFEDECTDDGHPDCSCTPDHMRPQ